MGAKRQTCRSFAGACLGLVLLVASLRAADDKPPTTESEPTPAKASADAGVVSQTVVLRGRTLAPEGNPLPGVRLWLTIDEWTEPVELGASDANGNYRLEIPQKQLRRTVTPGFHLAKCQATLAAAAEGFGPAWEELPSTEGGRIGPVKSEYVHDFQLVADHPIQGRVVGVDGHPIADAIVSVDAIHDLAGRQWYKMPKAIEATDPDLMTREETDVNNWFTPLYPTAWNRIPGARTDSKGRFQLEGLGANRAIRLKVYGAGIRSATVSVLTREDAEGFTKAIREKYPRTPEPNGYFYPPRPNTASGDGGVRLYGPSPVIDVDPARTASGVVRDAVTGKPLAGVRVRTAGNYGEASTGANGRYCLLRMEDQSAIDVYVDVDSDKYLKSVRRVENVQQLGDVVVNFDIRWGVLLSGRVVEEGSERPIVSAPFCGCHDTSPCPLRTGYATYYPLATNTELRNAPEGLYFAGVPSYATNYPLTVPIDPEGAFHMAIPPGPGVILIQSSPGFPEFPSIEPVKESEGLHKLFRYRALTARDKDDGGPGEDPASLPGFSGPISLARHHAYRVINPAVDANSLDLVFPVPLAPSRQLNFVDPDGRPLAGAIVQGLVVGSWGPGHKIVVEGSEVDVVGLDPTEPREIVATSADRQLIGTSLITGDSVESVTIQLEPAASITGTLKDESTEKPLAGYSLNFSYQPASPQAADNSFGLWMGTTNTDADGHFVFRGLRSDLLGAITVHQPPPRQFWIGSLPEFHPDHLQKLDLQTGEARNVGDIRIKPVDLP